MLHDKLSAISRRDLMRLFKEYGKMSVLIAAGGMTGAITLPGLARAANSVYEKRFTKEARFNLKFGAAGFNERNTLIERAGVLEFVRDIEERTDGEIRVEFIGNNQICNQGDCVKKAQQGIVDIYAASTQNSAGGAPYLNVLDYAFMFPSRASQYHFFYHPESQKLLRDPLRARHGVHFLFTHCELRGLPMGLKYSDRPLIKSVTELAGTKNRVTGTQLGRIAMNLMNLNPVPVAWEEFLDGLKSGLLDGGETWASAVAYANMSPVVSQFVDLEFFCGTEHTAMNASVFDGLGGELQDAVMESSYTTQILVQHANEAALVKTVGYSDPQLPNTIFAQNKTRVAFLSPEAKKEAMDMCSPELHQSEWAEWRDRLDNWAGGVDTYKTISEIARQVPDGTLPENVEPRRWWKSA